MSSTSACAAPFCMAPFCNSGDAVAPRGEVVATTASPVSYKLVPSESKFVTLLLTIARAAVVVYATCWPPAPTFLVGKSCAVPIVGAMAVRVLGLRRWGWLGVNIGVPRGNIFCRGRAAYIPARHPMDHKVVRP